MVYADAKTVAVSNVGVNEDWHVCCNAAAAAAAAAAVSAAAEAEWEEITQGRANCLDCPLIALSEQASEKESLMSSAVWFAWMGEMDTAADQFSNTLSLSLFLSPYLST